MKPKKTLSARTIAILALIFVLVLIELVFDPIEIVLGNLLFWTNSVRPKIGTLWVEEQKDLTGSTEVASISENVENSIALDPVRDLDDMRALLDLRGEILLSRQNFLSIYKQLPPEKAKAIIPPLDLLEIDHSNDWQYTRLVAGEIYLQIYLLDAFGQVLLDSYPKQNILRSETVIASSTSALNQETAFRDRIVTAEVFHSAYDQLPRSLRMQVINNPYKLIQWGENLKRVAISRYVENGVVEIAFEVQINARSSVYRFQARELAIAHLISILNEHYLSKPFDLPVRMDDSN